MYNYQSVANIHYGYVGSSVGFPSLFLQVGAGVFQDEASRGDLRTFYDDHSHFTSGTQSPPHFTMVMD